MATLLSSVGKSSTRVPATRAPNEQFIEEQGLVLAGGYTARIDARLTAKNGFRDGNLRSLGPLPKDRTIRFQVTTDVPAPHQMLWKVRNRGDEATRVGQLRGELIPDDGTQRRTETTSYSGRHYVEVYVVKGNRVVATDHHEVRIA